LNALACPISNIFGVYIMLNPSFTTIKQLADSYPDNALNQYTSNEPAQQAIKITTAFGLPDTLVEKLSKIIRRQLQSFIYNCDDKNIASDFHNYITAIYNIACIGYIAASAICDNKDLFACYYKNVTQLFLKHGELAEKLTPLALHDISCATAQMINIALVAFNLTDCTYYFVAFKKSIKTLENRLNAFDTNDKAAKEAKQLFATMIY
jgi:hypothetical protein